MRIGRSPMDDRPIEDAEDHLGRRTDRSWPEWLRLDSGDCRARPGSVRSARSPRRRCRTDRLDRPKEDSEFLVFLWLEPDHHPHKDWRGDEYTPLRQIIIVSDRGGGVENCLIYSRPHRRHGGVGVAFKCLHRHAAGTCETGQRQGQAMKLHGTLTIRLRNGSNTETPSPAVSRRLSVVRRRVAKVAA